MYPMYKQIELALLQELVGRGGRPSPSDKDAQGRTVYDALADHFDLSKEDRERTFLDEGKPRSKWENMVRWACRKLKDKGLLCSPHRGVWAVTVAGRELVRG